MSTKFYTKWRCILNVVCILLIIPQAVWAQEAIEEIAFSEEKNIDPLEPLNRSIDHFNMALDKFALKPITRAYRLVIPAWGRQRIAYFLRNLATPVTFFNNILQGDINQASISFWRFTFNSTFGLGGLFDFAAEQGLHDKVEDFGQTLGTYNIPPGPYIMLPLLGPSSVRDATGRIADAFLDPFYILFTKEETIARLAVDTIEFRSQTLSLTDEIERTSLDPYATTRSLYLQSRKDLVSNGMEVPELDFEEDY